MKFQSTRIIDISRALGFSPSTVSRALRDSHEISPATKAIVLACAEKLHYSPNPLARGLRNRKSQAIAIIVSDLSNAFFSQVLSGVEAVAGQHDFKIIIVQHNPECGRGLKELELLTSSVDGIIISVPEEKESVQTLASLHQRGFPMVLFDRLVPELNVHTVVLDNHKASFLATAHLINNGYKRIGAIANTAHLYKGKDRLKGYTDALEERFINVDPDLIQKNSAAVINQTEVDKQVHALLALPQPVDAIVVLDDQLTKAVLKTIRTKGLRIPGDIAIVGFSNSDFYELLSPPLTIVQQPAAEMGRLSAALILKQIKSKRPVTDFEHVVLEPQLVVRESAGEKPTR